MQYLLFITLSTEHIMPVDENMMDMVEEERWRLEF